MCDAFDILRQAPEHAYVERNGEADTTKHAEQLRELKRASSAKRTVVMRSEMREERIATEDFGPCWASRQH